MSDSNGERREPKQDEPTVRVTDRRRVRLDENGNPAPTQEASEGASAAAADAEVEVGEEVQAAAPPSAEEYARVQQELEAARRRVDELARAYQALDRDRDEFKQRLQRERDRMLDVEKGKAMSVVLEAIDELDRCLGAGAQDDSPLAQGVRFIRDGLLRKVQSEGLERIEVVGRHYDPNTAEAIDMEVTPNEDEDQKVLSEVRAGYRYKERVLRPARVKVAKFVPAAQA